ncbi:MAG: citrate/2-methylcitrate synthase [Planctomyces sp.]
MERQRQPDLYLTEGLKRLVRDIRQTDPLPGHGLAGIACSSTDLISFESEGVQYCGHPVEQLTEEQSFDEVAWLLMNGALPDGEHTADMQAIVSDSAVIDAGMAEMLERIPLGTRPLDLLPLSISLLSFFDPVPHDQCRDATRLRVWRLLAQLPVMIASGLPASGSSRRDDSELDLNGISWAGRLLYLLRDNGAVPSPAEDAAINVVMICECLTEMRPACFAARFAASTVNHILASLQSASTLFVSQLKNDPFQWVSELLQGFSGPSSAETWWKSRENRSMPFGFGEPEADPRPAILRETCRSLLRSIDRLRNEASACRLEKIMAEQQLEPTIDWLAARAMTLLEIPSERQSLVIGMARLVGWAAQAIEQQNTGISLLPVLRYGARSEN